MLLNDDYFMRQAIRQAQIALEAGEIPVGAVVVCNNVPIAKAHNQTERLRDVTAHAEMLAITSASDYLDGKFLNGCTLYVTLEPCVMCAGALHWARPDRIVYGAPDPKRGFARLAENILHPRTQLVAGVCGEECTDLLRLFFERKREE